MANLIYSAIASLDGFIEDASGSFDWAAPDEEVHRFINDLERPAGTYLFGRRMYETMMAWETEPSLAADSPILRDYAEIWQAADKIVYSRTLEAPSTSKTRIERDFEPDRIRQLKAAARHDLLIGGPGLATQAFRAGLIDECHPPGDGAFGRPALWQWGGVPALPSAAEERRLTSGEFSGVSLRSQRVLLAEAEAYYGAGWRLAQQADQHGFGFGAGVGKEGGDTPIITRGG